MKQSIELLQMGTMQLRDYLEKELEENPMVEVEMNERLYLDINFIIRKSSFNDYH